MRQVWHSAEFAAHVNQLRDYSRKMTGRADAYLNTAVDAINSAANDSGGWLKSGYIPGKDWNGGPYQPLYDCLGDGHDEQQRDTARKFFGNLVCHVLMNRDDEWEAYPGVDKTPGHEESTLYHRRA